MGIIKVFVKNKCPRCPQAKEVGNTLREAGFNVIEYDVETPDGLAEASFYSVQATPTLIVADQQENTIADFRGVVPSVQQIHDLFYNNAGGQMQC
ncbi:MAG: thioredoxin family protein [Desulfobacterota bacterium]|nr:thioredoxin family protein [Thermodesulfobacteriota bacterium]